MGKPFRILSLDGGGSWALIQARALMKLYGETATGHDVLKDFDLVAANSGGSLVLGELIENLSLKAIDNLFQNAAQRASIFAPLGIAGFGDKILEATLHLGPKYSAARKFIGIQRLLTNYGATSLDQLLGTLPSSNRPWPMIMIPAFDYDLRRAVFFRSDTQSLAYNWTKPKAPTLAEAIHASTNAPINYFDQPAVFPASAGFVPHRYWDGAVGGYNNPVEAAVLEALVNQNRYEIEPGSIVALTIGTGNTSLPLVEPDSPTTADPALVLHQRSPNLPADIAEMGKSVVSDPPDAATYAAHLALGGAGCCFPDKCVSDSVVRMNPLIRPCLQKDTWVLPKGLTASNFESLVDLDMDATKQSDVDLINTFCDLWLNGDVPNQAIRANELFETLIGQADFAGAELAWRKVAVLPVPNPP
ncbi:patatin-like phospholipase family protein [Caballeronia sp. LjRoot31]|uniref:patatin-like phospholipase family protein n=1 Tax=Caballeronia sp. LjRoot31 TaxID=3342324 RepID=UPI003ECC7E4B